MPLHRDVLESLIRLGVSGESAGGLNDRLQSPNNRLQFRVRTRNYMCTQSFLVLYPIAENSRIKISVFSDTV